MAIGAPLVRGSANGGPSPHVPAVRRPGLAGFTFLFVFGLLAIGGDAATARAPTSEERSALTAQSARFDTAMRANDFDTVVETIPPKVMAHIATRIGAPVDELKKLVVKQMVSVLAAVKLVNFSMDLAKAEDKELGDGTPYSLIPTETVMEVGGQKMRVRSHTLALLDEGRWYLLRVSEQQQVGILREVYPGFAKVEFPAGTTEAVKD